MEKQHTLTSTHQDEIQQAVEEALVAETSRGHYEVPRVLWALHRLLIKNKTLAGIMGVDTTFVAQILNGRRSFPEKYRERLFFVLRDAIKIGKRTIADAESGKKLWGNKRFPVEALDFMKGRIAEAEAVLVREAEAVLKRKEKAES